MINVSTEYFESINAPMRKQMNFTVGIGVANTEMANHSTYSDNGHMRYSNTNGLKNLIVSNKIYVTAEPNMYILDGEHEITPQRDTFQGYVSSMVSDDSGEFSTSPKITIQSDGSYDLIGFTIKFDEENNDYCTEFQIKYYNSSNQVIRTKNVTDNIRVQYIDDTETSNVNKIEVIFNKTHNYGRRVRVTSITLGIYEEFYGGGRADNTIVSMSHDLEISPLMKDIPINDFSFTINDEKANYNAENPTGIWKYTKKGQIVTLKYIQTLNDGGEESVVGGRFYLEDRPSTSDTNATFTAVSRLESLEQTYNEGEYYLNGRSYYNLFDDVFKYCGLNEGEYEIDEDLKNMITMIPLPIESAKTCIQLLCQACGKIAFEDISGKIWIKDNNDTVNEYYLSLTQDHSYPSYSEETSEVKNIIMTKYTENVSSETEEVAKSTFTLGSTNDVTISYDLSTGHTYEITGGTVNSGNFYGRCCKLNITPTSSLTPITVTVNGNRIEETATDIIYSVSNKGFDCELDFRLLSENSVANRLYAIYSKYLGESKRYDIDYRGNPELRPNDIIQIGTRFAEELNAMILKSRFNWDSGASGTLTLKNYTEVE